MVTVLEVVAVKKWLDVTVNVIVFMPLALSVKFGGFWLELVTNVEPAPNGQLYKLILSDNAMNDVLFNNTLAPTHAFTGEKVTVWLI